MSANPTHNSDERGKMLRAAAEKRKQKYLELMRTIMLEEIADEFALHEFYQDLVMREEQDSHAKMDENHQPQKALRDSLDKLKDKKTKILVMKIAVRWKIKIMNPRNDEIYVAINESSM